jgi:hypothetical protein
MIEALQKIHYPEFPQMVDDGEVWSAGVAEICAFYAEPIKLLASQRARIAGVIELSERIHG